MLLLQEKESSIEKSNNGKKVRVADRRVRLARGILFTRPVAWQAQVRRKRER